MFLATTALTEFWDADQELVLLGPWCLDSRRRSEWTDRVYTVLPCPWDDRDRFAAAHRVVTDAYERLLPIIGEYLDSLHRAKDPGRHVERRSTRYWRILIGPWLFRFLHTVYDRYECARLALDAHPSIETWTVGPDAVETPFDTTEFIHWILGDVYNLQIFSEVFRFLGWDFATKPAPQMPARPAPARSIRARVRVSVGLALGRSASIALCDPYCGRRETIALMIATKLAVRPKTFSTPTASGDPADRAGRRELGTLVDGIAGEFGSLIGRLLPAAMPRVFVEDFLALQDAAFQRQGRRPKIVVSAAGWHQNEAFKAYAADCMEQGSQLLAVQHGGAYGTFEDQPQETHEVGVADAFATWGWKQRPSHRPLPSMQLARFERATKGATSSTILLVTTVVPRYFYLFQSSPVAQQFQEYMTWQTRLVSALHERRRDLVVRVNPLDYGHGVKDHLQRAFPDLAFDRDRSSVEAYASAGLVILDHPITAMWELLVLNRPVLMMWNPAHWATRSAAASVFDSLRSAGVLHDQPESAAVAAREIATHADEWWSAPAIQRVRADAIAQFGRTSRHWSTDWTTTFGEMLKNSR